MTARHQQLQDIDEARKRRQLQEREDNRKKEKTTKTH